MSKIEFWNPYSGKIEKEQVFGDGGIRFIYENAVGAGIRPLLARSPFISRLYGRLQSSPSSRKQIPGFISQFNIQMQQFEEARYESFNDFFIRKFRTGMRPFAKDPDALPAPCEARYLFFDHVDDTTRVSVKGARLSPSELLGEAQLAKDFDNGALAIARLCPVDYHRFHFFDSCKITQSYTRHGRYESVNPVAVQRLDDLFLKNERQISILETAHFGKAAMIEVGALCVGKIVQSYPSKPLHDRGEEKGYFLFGGSTVIILFEREKITWRNDYLEKSRSGIETFVRLGDTIGESTTRR